MAVRPKSPDPDSIEAILKGLRQAYQDGYAAAEKAFADAATAGRCVNDRAIATLGGQGEALIAAYKRIGDLEGANASLVKLLDGMAGSYAQKEIIEAQKEIEKDRTAKDFAWRQEAIKQLGPGIPRLVEMVLARMGVAAPASDAEDRAALMRALPKLLGDVELTSRIQVLVGDDDWQRILKYLGRITSEPSAATTQANGAAPN